MFLKFLLENVSGHMIKRKVASAFLNKTTEDLLLG